MGLKRLIIIGASLTGASVLTAAGTRACNSWRKYQEFTQEAMRRAEQPEFYEWLRTSPHELAVEFREDYPEALSEHFGLEAFLSLVPRKLQLRLVRVYYCEQLVLISNLLGGKPFEAVGYTFATNN